MTLRKMRDEDYARWLPRLRSAYADDKQRANGYTKEEASAVADNDLKRLLPEGLATPQHFFFASEQDGQVVGYAWIHLRSIGGESQAFIYDIIIEEEAQGKGYGRATMLALEQEAKTRGASRIALHVFGFNHRAIQLYQSLGFETTDLTMEKRL